MPVVFIVFIPHTTDSAINIDSEYSAGVDKKEGG